MGEQDNKFGLSYMTILNKSKTNLKKYTYTPPPTHTHARAHSHIEYGLLDGYLKF